MIKFRKLFGEIKPYLDSPEAIIITGMRRTGKTTLLNYIYQQTDSNNKIFMDLENPLNRKYLEEENYENIKRSFQFQGIDFTRKAFIFLDEIQLVKNLPSVVKFFIDHYQTKFFLTGSASFYLKNFFTESLAGRKYIFELFPLSFQEFLSFKEVTFKIPENPQNITRAIFNTIAPLYEEYIIFGGFPQVVLKTGEAEKRKSLEEVFSSFFQLEVIQLGDFKRNEVIRDLMLFLLQRVGSRMDIQKIAKEVGVSRPTLIQYISFLENTYFIKTIKPLSKGRDSEIRKMPKVYCCDTGLANHFARLDMGPLFENSVFQNIRMQGELNYYHRKSGGEIDFILNQKTGYEVKITPDASEIKKTEKIAKELGLAGFKIISKNYIQLPNTTYAFML